MPSSLTKFILPHHCHSNKLVNTQVKNCTTVHWTFYRLRSEGNVFTRVCQSFCPQAEGVSHHAPGSVCVYPSIHLGRGVCIPACTGRVRTGVCVDVEMWKGVGLDRGVGVDMRGLLLTGEVHTLFPHKVGCGWVEVYTSLSTTPPPPPPPRRPLTRSVRILMECISIRTHINISYCITFFVWYMPLLGGSVIYVIYCRKDTEVWVERTM